MNCFVGLDVSLKEISICVVDAEGTVTAQGCAPADPEGVAGWLRNRSLTPDCIVHESGLLSIWLQRGLVQLGLPVECIDARKAHKSLSARLNKSDAADAEGLAQLARTGWFTPVHLHSDASDRLRNLIGARERLIRLRVDLEGYVRGALTTFGIRMSAVRRGRQRQAFRDQLAAAGETDPMLRVIADAFIAAHATLCKAVTELDAIIRERHQSGEADWSGRISKCGDRTVRGLLIQSASCVLCQAGRFSALKSWASRLADRRGHSKAAVATARKITVLMLTLWKGRQT